MMNFSTPVQFHYDEMYKQCLRVFRFLTDRANNKCTFNKMRVSIVYFSALGDNFLPTKLILFD